MNGQAMSGYLAENDVVGIRAWDEQDEAEHRCWPPYQDPFAPLWNLPRPAPDFDTFFFLPFGRDPVRSIWAIEDQEGCLIGRISLRDVNRWKRSARLGITLHSHAVGKGLGTETLVLFLTAYFRELDFNTMLLDVAACNERAVRCYRRLGFRLVAEEWRTSYSSSALEHLDDMAYTHMRPYFRRHLSGYLVLFFEMEMHRREWRKIVAQRRAMALAPDGNVRV